MARGFKMKRTERISVGLTKDEKAIIRGRAAESHLTMSAFIRNLVLTERRQQYIPSQNPLPRLNRPPRTPKKQEPFITELKAVLSKGVDIYFRKYEHKPSQNLNEAGQIALQKIYDE